jgi:uncharacterized repeat protein (TIGR01451 family)/fimbrial isopeptide formation D2 family protein
MQVETTRRNTRMRRRTLRFQTLRSRLTAFALAPAVILSTIGLGVWGATSATAAPLPAPSVSIGLQDSRVDDKYGDADAKPFILAGEDAVFDVSLKNSSSTGGYNIAFALTVPNGVSFVSSGGLGTPVVYASGATLPNSSKTTLAKVPAGSQLWVFEDVADLPGTADFSGTLTVRPDAGVFPVGAAPSFSLAGYVSSVASMKPIFDGSTGVGGTAALAETSSGTQATTAPVKALRLTKDEPSPEIELLRGVHDSQTVYTLTVENTGQADTNGVTLVDYIPAGLEFLACGTVDNTLASPSLYNGAGAVGGTLEYPGSGPITGSAPEDCLTPASVETVNTGIPANLPAGVYTKVTWNLPSLTGGTAQSFPNAAGTPGTFVIRYVAAVPLFENTMTFVSESGSTTPSPASLDQAANLDNNRGASTRQGQPDGFNDGILYTNSATVSGTYVGPLASGASNPVSDSDTEQIQAMDLRVLKGVDTSAGAATSDEFVAGGLATFSLDVATSEYTTADRMTLTDVLPNGLCPALPANAATLSGDTWPAECANPSSASGVTLTGASIDRIVYDASEGTFTMTFTPTPDAMAAQGTHRIVYTALMRSQYTDDDAYVGSTSSGDALTNHVEIEGQTTAIRALATVTNGAGVSASGDEDDWDDSSAEIGSGYSSIGKRVLARDAIIDGGGAPSAAASCAVPATSGSWADNQTESATPFVPGDVVCYELTVDFATQIDVRNPLVTDFLPSGVSYLDWALAPGTDDIDAGAVNLHADGQRLDFEVGTPGDGGDRFVPLGSKLVLHVLGTVTSWTPNDEATLDKPENLMKYQQENVTGDVYFLRDAAAIQTGQGPALVKGVSDVDGDATLAARTEKNANGTVFGSDRDGISVVQGDGVTYRVDLTGGTSAVEDMVVWDALPAGIRNADVSAAAGATVYNPGDAGYPATLPSAYAGRSVIVWTGIDLAAAAQRTLTYDVTMPAGILVDTDFPNTASIVNYALPLNTGESHTVYPTGSLDNTVRPAADTVPGEGTRDDSLVYTPIAAVAKSLVNTEVGPATANLDPNNGNAQAAQGELITYRYSVTVPAHTSVQNAVLRDRGTLTPGNIPLTVTDASWTATALTGATAANFTLAQTDGAARGVLTFPTTYTNSSNADQVFTVTLTGYVGDAGNHNTVLTNQAQFRSASYDANVTATVTYIEPSIAIDKTAAPTANVAVGDPITYTLKVTNASGRPLAYDDVVVDTVPAGLIVDASTFSIAPASYDLGLTSGAGGEIRWNIPTVSATAPVTITYRASIDPSAGGGISYTNEADLTGHTLPSTLAGTVDTRRGDRAATDTATVTAVSAAIDKGVRVAGSTGAYGATATGPIGQTMQYRVDVTLNANINYYDPVITDDLPAGVTLVDATITGPTATPSTGVTGTWAYTLNSGSNLATWTYSGDILSQPETRHLTLTYEVLLSDSVAANVNDLDNTAVFRWNRVNDDTATRSTVTDGAAVDVLNPVLGIDKTVSDTTPDPAQPFSYGVTVTNTGTTAAHHIVVSDDVPTGVVVDPSSISHGGAITGRDATTGGGTITWELTGPLAQTAPGNTLVLTYGATLAPSSNITDTEVLTNTATVDHYESFPSGGRDYDPTNVTDTAAVDPAFPNVVLAKTPTGGDIASAGAPFGWTLTLRNTGDGAAQTIAARDVLPKNWTFDEGSATISRAGAAPVALADPAVTTASGVQTLSWSAAQVSPTTPALPAASSSATDPTRAIVIRFTATPTTAALTDAGATADNGTRVPHTNTLTATTTDTSGATENESGTYTGPNATANAFISAADLRLVKDGATTPLVAGGAAGTAWTITVSNLGPDTAVGPFTVTDTWGDAGVLPDGFTVTGFTGDGWTCAPTGTTGFTCERSNANDILASGASFAPITVTARAAAGFDPADAPVNNSATVTSGTYDRHPTNNTDTGDVPVAISADLQIVKTGPASAPNAGGPITWTLTVANNGAADSVSTTAKPITVTDTIPDGVENVTLGTLPAGWTASTTAPLNAGDTVTLTLANGSRLTPTQTVAFSLTGTVDASHAASDPIANTARVTPGATTDPVPANNESTTTVTPTIDTTLGVDKTRVVQVGGAWVPAASQSPVPALVPGAPVTYLVTVANTGTADARAVTVADQVPDYLTYGSVTSVDGTWTRTSTTAAAGDDQTFALTGDLAAGASASFRVTLTVDAAHTATVANTVVADATNATNDPSDTDSSDSERVADLSIAKSHTGSAVAGSTLPYTVTVTNNGPSDSSGPIVITDTLPAGFGLAPGSARVSVAGGPAVAAAPTVAGQGLTWTVGSGSTSLAPGAQIVITFTAKVDASVLDGTYVNTATVSGPDDDDPGNNTAEDPTPVTTSADLSVVKTVTSAGPYVAGQSVTYTVDVTNAGPSVARNVVLADLVPAGMTVADMSGAGWTCDDATGVCDRAVLPVGTSTLTVTAAIDPAVPNGSDLTNTATVTSSTPDPTTPNTDTETVPVTALADIAIVKTAIAADGTEITSADAGTTVRYLLEVTNHGPSAAVGPLTIADTLPAGFSYLAIESGDTAWACETGTTDPQQVSCITPAGLGAGASATDLVLLVAIDPAQPVGTSTNVAAVTSPTTDLVPANNTYDAPLDVTQSADLSIVKTHDSDAVRIGDELTFTLEVENAGPSDATGVTVTDTLPQGLEYIDAGASDPAWTVTAAPAAADGTTTVTATLTGSLATGAVAPTLEITTLVHPEAYDEVTNVAVVDATQPDPDTADNTSEDPVTVPPLASLVVEKVAVGAFQVGSDATYRITVRNDGPTEDPGPIVVTDELPWGLAFRSASGDGATCTADGQLVTCTIDGGLAVDASVTLTVAVTVQPGAYPSVVNTAVVTSPTEQTPDAELSSSATVQVASKPLPATGGALPWIALNLAVILLLVGLVLAMRRRRAA